MEPQKKLIDEPDESAQLCLLELCMSLRPSIRDAVPRRLRLFAYAFAEKLTYAELLELFEEVDEPPPDLADSMERSLAEAYQSGYGYLRWHDRYMRARAGVTAESSEPSARN